MRHALHAVSIVPRARACVSLPLLSVSSCWFSSSLNHKPNQKKRNLFGSNEFRRRKHLKQVAAQEQKQQRQVAKDYQTHIDAQPKTPLSIPSVCLGCGATLQTEYPEIPGYIHKQSIDKYQQEIDKINRITQADRERDRDRDRDRDRGMDESETRESFSGSSPSSSLPSTPLPADWQESFRRGEISIEELSSHNIEVLSPKQLKQELKLLHSSLYSPSSSSVRVPVPRPLRCVRCYQLSHYGYRRGNPAAIETTDFRYLLKQRFLVVGGKSCVILKLIDIWDIQGSMIQEFTSLVGGRNPIILVINKKDLLPASYGENRLHAWMKAEAKKYGIQFHSIHFVSAKTGDGISQLMSKAVKLAAANTQVGHRDIYLIGTTNTGKSALINKLREMRYIQQTGNFIPSTIAETDTNTLQAQERDQPTVYLDNGGMTSSMFPGTTLGMVGFSLIPRHRGIIYDTPGVINMKQLATRLQFDELKALHPPNRLLPVTYRLSAGQSMLLGGLARLDLVEGRPFFFTAFVSSLVTVHITNADKLDAEGGKGMIDFFHQHCGGLISPPFTAQRWDDLQLAQANRVRFDLKGVGWHEASDDIVFPGIGWVAVTGVGPCTVRASMVAVTRPLLPSSSAVSAANSPCLPFAREPLMPFESKTSSVKFYGSDRRAKRTHRQTPSTRQQQVQPTSLSSSSTQRTNMQLARAFSTTRRETSIIDVESEESKQASPVVVSFPSALSSFPPLSVPVVRPSWSVYRAALVNHRAAVLRTYRRTEEYLKRPKGSWRLRKSGEWIKLFRPLKRVKMGKFREAIQKRKTRKMKQQLEAQTQDIRHT